METGPISSFRLILVVGSLRKTPAYVCQWIRRGNGWRERLRILYGMDVWWGRVPLVRTIAVAHLVLWTWRVIA